MNKRIWAIVGLVFMVMIIALNTYALATGAFLHGLFPLFLCPLFGGVCASFLFGWKTQSIRPNVALLVIIAGLIAIGINLIIGIPALISQI